MATTKRAPLTFGLEDSKVSLAPLNTDWGVPNFVEPPAATFRSPVSFPSLKKTEQVVPYPIRLTPATIKRLEKLKSERGVVPAAFIRDAIESALDALEVAEA